ncbi:MAG: SDR family oxidoreductase [Methanocellales archaeon]|nr:SDR family oxidoreductase [Methanocellales archaeon]
MKALVTGGAGFIGSHLVDKLLEQGHHVICLDNFDPYYDPKIKRENIRHRLDTDNFELVEGDILDKTLLKKIIHDDGIDYIFHNAAQAGIRVSVENPIKPHDINTTGTLNILETSLDSDVKKIINASSSSVYGKAEYLPFDEVHPKTPVSPYGVSKLAAEHYCRVFNEVYGLKTTSLRLFTVYGPRMRPDLAISIFTRRALNNETIEIFGDGNKTRDFTYIDDVVEANMKAIGKGDGEAYNIGSGKRISVIELAEKIIDITQSNPKIIFTDPRKGDAEHTWANIEKAKKELDWEPKYDIHTGLKKYVEYVQRRT